MKKKEKKGNKKYFISVPIILVLIMLILVVKISKDSYAIDDLTSITMSRENMQNLVVSTALSYYYNQIFSNYEQYAMDDKTQHNDPYNFGSFYFSSLTSSPEEVSRSNRYNVDCSVFATMVYLYSLGYDMSDYYNIMGIGEDINLFKNFNVLKVGGSPENYKDLYTNIGLSATTFELTQMTAYDLAGTATLSSTPEGEIKLDNSNNNKKQSVFFYNVNTKSTYDGSWYNEDADTQLQIKNKIKETLQPGDILVYRKYNTETKNSGGHAMLYVGDSFSGDKNGIIHSSGIDYDFANKKINEDTYSIRYDLFENYINDFFVASETAYSTYFSIIRPINTYCDGDECSIDEKNVKFNAVYVEGKYYEQNYSLENAIARNDLSNLRIEQYESAPNEDNTNILIKNKYNSFNVDNNITYNLFLMNMSNKEYCSNGYSGYNNKSDCEAAGFSWDTRKNSLVDYKNLTITAKIPDNTEFVSCNYSCKKDGNIITWTDVNVNVDQYLTYKYTVKPLISGQIINEGMNIKTEKGNILKMSNLKSNVNPTINNDSVSVLHENIEKFTVLVNDGKITYNSSANNYKFDLNNISNEKISNIDFVKNIYYNTFGIDLSSLNYDNIKTAIFNNGTGSASNVYAKKTDTEVSEITNVDYKNINKMIVKGLYGGRLVKGNDNYDRTRYITGYDFEIGDILLAYDLNNNTIEASIFYGRDNNDHAIIVEFNKDNSGNYKILEHNDSSTDINTGYKHYKLMFDKDLFVVLRPSQLYGSTVNYNYNINSLNNSSYIEYKNLSELNVSDAKCSITFNNNGGVNEITVLESNASLVNLYSDKNLTKIFDFNSTIEDGNNYNVYAKWKCDEIILPTAVKEDYTFIGWYDENDNKVGEAAEKYEATGDMILTAKYTDEKNANLPSDENNTDTSSDENIINPSTGTYIYFIIPILLISIIIIVLYYKKIRKEATYN